MDKNKTVTFFGGAQNNTKTKEYTETIEIGKVLSQHFDVLFCGGYRGLMEAVCIGFDRTKIGVTCQSFGSAEGNSYLDHTIKEADIYSRLRSLILPTTNLSDLYILQTGGIGTLSELFLVLDVLRKEKLTIPKVVLYGEFWEFIYDMPKHIVDVILDNCVNIASPGHLKEFLNEHYGTT